MCSMGIIIDFMLIDPLSQLGRIDDGTKRVDHFLNLIDNQLKIPDLIDGMMSKRSSI